MTESDRDVTARQLLHAATGDRDAEAAVLAEQSDAGTDAAKLAVKQAHGDMTDRPKIESDLASPADVREVESTTTSTDSETER